LRQTASEKIGIIRLVEGSDLPVKMTLRQLGVPRSTFYVTDQPPAPLFLLSRGVQAGDRRRREGGLMLRSNP
jgi:hypothetical protein